MLKELFAIKHNTSTVHVATLQIVHCRQAGLTTLLTLGDTVHCTVTNKQIELHFGGHQLCIA